MRGSPGTPSTTVEVSVRIRPFLEQYDEDCVDGVAVQYGTQANTLGIPGDDYTGMSEKG